MSNGLQRILTIFPVSALFFRVADFCSSGEVTSEGVLLAFDLGVLLLASSSLSSSFTGTNDFLSSSSQLGEVGQKMTSHPSNALLESLPDALILLLKSSHSINISLNCPSRAWHFP